MIEKIFTHQESINNFEKFGKLHIITLFLMVIYMFYCYKIEENDKFEKISTYIIFVNQVVLLFWYATGDFFLKEGLPLYTCRFAGFAYIFSYLFKNDLLKSIGVYLGFIGGIIAMLTPSLYPYNMIHFTNMNFFVFHIILLGTSVYYLSNDFDGVIYEDRKAVQIITVFILITAAIINNIFDANYAYTAESPIFTNIVDSMSWILYFLILMFLYEVSIYLESLMIKKLIDIKSDGYEIIR